MVDDQSSMETRLLLGAVSIKTTPTDIFPEIDIPVVTAVSQTILRRVKVQGQPSKKL